MSAGQPPCGGDARPELDEPGAEHAAPSAPGTRGLFKDSAVTFASRLAAIVISIGIASSSSWLLGPSGRGVLNICLVFAQLLVLGLGFGVEMGCAYYAGSNRKPLGTVLGTQLAALGISTVLIVGVGFICMNSSLAFVEKVPPLALACAIGFAVAQVLFVLMTVLFMGLGRLVYYNVARIANQGLTLLFLFAGCWFIRDPSVAVAAYVGGSLIAGLFLVGVLARQRPRPRLTFSWSALSDCYKYGIKYYFGKLATLVDAQVGVMVFAMMGSTEQVGLFAAALGLASRLFILPETLNIVLLPRVLVEQTALVGLVLKSCRTALIPSIVAAGVLAAVSKPLIAILLSPAFLPAVTPLLILLPGVVLGCVTRVLVSYFNGTGKPEYTSATLLVGVTLNITLMILLLPRWGIAGVATAASVAYAVEAGLAAILFTRLTGTSLTQLAPGPEDLRTIITLVRSRIVPRRKAAGDQETHR